MLTKNKYKIGNIQCDIIKLNLKVYILLNNTCFCISIFVTTTGSYVIFTQIYFNLRLYIEKQHQKVLFFSINLIFT